MSRYCIGLLVCALFALPLAATAQEDHSGHGHGEPDMEAMMKATMPGPMHEHMAAMVGEWTTHTKMWMQPGTPPMESEGTSVFEMTLDGRFLQEIATGTMMGRPMTSVKIYGYHNAKQKFETVWMYTMSTGMLSMEGVFQEDGSVVFEGTYLSDMGEEGIMKVVAVGPDENTMVETVMGEHDMGNEDGVLMETTYTRVTAN